MHSGVRRLRSGHRGAVTLPSWFGPWTAAPLGLAATAADLPNAFPYVIAIERLAAADVGVGVGAGIAVLTGYALVYCAPCIVLLVVGTVWQDRLAQRLVKVYERFGAARDLPRSVPRALALTTAGLGLAVVAVSL